MSIKQHRINLGLEQPVFDAISLLAKKNDRSLSLQTKMLVLETLDIFEDVVLSEKAEMREKTFKKNNAKSHNDFWMENLK